MKKFYFSYSILFTVVALAATPSVVQSIPEQRSVGKEQSTHDDHPTTSVKQPSQELLIVGGEQSAPDDHPYFVEIESNQYPTGSPTEPKTNPPVSFNDCDGNESLRFQLELKTDYYPEETTWTLEEQSSDDGADFFGGDYTSTNTIYTEPSDDSYYCLKDDTCYLFTIYDSWGDGWDESEYLTGYFKGFLNDVEVFQDGGEFKFYSYNTIFCVGMPTTAPTGSPTLFPSGLPTESCIDNKKKRTCKKWFRKGNFKKVKKKCNKKRKEIKIYDWCPKTCGKKAGVGRCAFLKDQ